MAIEIAALAGEAVTIVAPFLRRLLSRAGNKAADNAGDELGDQAWESAKKVWRTLGPGVEANPAAVEVAQDVAVDWQDEKVTAALEVQLRKLLQRNPDIAAGLARDIGSIQVADRITNQTTNITASNRSLAGQRIDIRGDVKFGGEDAQMELFKQATGPAKLLMLIGFLVALVGIGGFMLLIAMALGQESEPNPAPIAASFGVGVVGMLIFGAGSLLALLGMRND